MPFVNFNGLINLQDEAMIHVQSRALRYGEGLIETIYFHGKTLRLFDYHYERLNKCLSEIHFPSFEKLAFQKELVISPPNRLESVEIVPVRKASFLGNEL